MGGGCWGSYGVWFSFGLFWFWLTLLCVGRFRLLFSVSLKFLQERHEFVSSKRCCFCILGFCFSMMVGSPTNFGETRFDVFRRSCDGGGTKIPQDGAVFQMQKLIVQGASKHHCFSTERGR